MQQLFPTGVLGADSGPNLTGNIFWAKEGGVLAFSHPFAPPSWFYCMSFLLFVCLENFYNCLRQSFLYWIPQNLCCCTFYVYSILPVGLEICVVCTLLFSNKLSLCLLSFYLPWSLAPPLHTRWFVFLLSHFPPAKRFGRHALGKIMNYSCILLHLPNRLLLYLGFGSMGKNWNKASPRLPMTCAFHCWHVGPVSGLSSEDCWERKAEEI